MSPITGMGKLCHTDFTSVKTVPTNTHRPAQCNHCVRLTTSVTRLPTSTFTY